MPVVRSAVATAPLSPPRRVAHSLTTVKVGVRLGAAPRGLSDTSVGNCLLRRLDAAVAHPSNHAMAALRSAVTDLVDRLKALGMPLDRIVVAVEVLLRERGAPCPRPTLHDGDTPPAAGPAAATRARVFDWCAGAYRDDAWW